MVEIIGELFQEEEKPLLRIWSVESEHFRRSFLRHLHTEFEICLVTKGYGEYTTNSKVYPMREGDMFVFSSNEIHAITRVDKSGISLLNLHFDPTRLFSGTYDNSNIHQLNFCFSHSDEFENRIPAEKADFLRTNFLMIKNEFLQNSTEVPLAVRSYLNLILIDLLRNHNYKSTSLKEYNNYLDFLGIYDYIDMHLTESLNLQKLASIVNLSPNYFSHIFKKLNGISLWDYITTKRIEKSVRLILSKGPRKSMLEIAIESGFNNTVNFNKAFKKIKGFTPSELKKNPELLNQQ